MLRVHEISAYVVHFAFSDGANGGAMHDSMADLKLMNDGGHLITHQLFDTKHLGIASHSTFPLSLF